MQFSTLVINYTISRKLDGMKPGLRPHATLSVLNLIKHMHLWMSTLKTLWLLALWCVAEPFIPAGIGYCDWLPFSIHHLLLKTFLMTCQHFLPLRKLNFVMNWIVTSALTLNMLLMQLSGGTRDGLFILASIVWRWITRLSLVSLFCWYGDTHW